MAVESTLLTTGEAAGLLGVSRQHVVDLCDRGEMAVIRVGTHRRIPRDEVDARLNRLTREQERSLWLHRAVVGELVRDPETVLARARANVERRRSAHRREVAHAYLAEWDDLLARGAGAVAAVATSRSPRACELRQNTPFAGVLSPEDRMQVLRSFAADWDRRQADRG